MKIINKHFLAILVVFLTTQISCKKDWLEAKADKTQSIPTTLADLQALIDNGAFFMNYYAPGLGEVASDGHYTTVTAWNNATDNAKNAYTWTNDLPYRFVNDWRVSYSKIFTSNLVLEGLEKLANENSTDNAALYDCKGQALFYRAYTFFDIAKQYSIQYDETSAAVDLGIPLKLESDITLPSQRSKVKETYDQILSDLIVAEQLLPSNTQYLRPGKSAAHALLARVFLSMRKYDSALTYANKCLQIKNTIVDYNSLSSTATYIGDYKVNSEIIFRILMPTTGYGGLLTFNCRIDTSLYNLYSSNDLRKSICFSVNPDNTISFKGNYNNNTSDLFSGLAVDEILLIRAECQARKNNIVAAMDDLNTLLIKRWKNDGSFVPHTAANGTDALNQILLERRKELLLRGLRWSDLKRLNKETNLQITLNRSIAGITYTLLPNSYKYTFPIPDDVIQLSGMQQNAGW